MLLLCLLAACLPHPAIDNSGEPVTITFACAEYEQAQYEPLVKMFHAQYPKITVQLVTESRGATMSTDELTKTAQLADTFTAYQGLLWFVDTPQNALLDLTPFADQDKTLNPDDFYPAALDAFRKHGKLWGLPVTFDVHMIFYDRKVFQENNVAEPEIGWSWQDFLEKATALTRRAGEGGIQYGYVDLWPNYALPMLAHQKAQPLVNPAAPLSQVRIDRPEVAEALQWYADLVLVHDVMPDPNDDSDALSQIVYTQEPAMWADFVFGYSNYRAIKGDIGAVPFPEDGDPATTIFAYGAFISAGTTHPEAAWKWINFLSQQPPIQDDIIPPRKSVGEHSSFWENIDKKTAEAFRYALDHAVATPDAVTGALYRAYDAILTGAPAQQALNDQQPKLLATIEEEAAAANQPAVAITVATPFPTPRPGGATVRFMMPRQADIATYRTLAQRFQAANGGANTDIVIELVPADSAGQSPADSVDAWAGYLWGEPSEVLPLDAFIESGSLDLSLYPPQTLAVLRQQGKLLGLPFQVNPPLLYYNRDLFESKGVAAPAADWTPQRLIEEAVALTDGAGVYGFYPDRGAYARAADFVTRMGGNLFDEDGTPTFADSTVAQAIAGYVQLLTYGAPTTARSEPPAPRFSQSSMSVFSNANPGTVDEGNIAMWVHSFGEHSTAIPTSFATGVAPFLPGSSLAPDWNADNLYISAKSENPAAAWAWLSFLSAQPEAVNQLPVSKGTAADPAWAQRVGQETAAAWRQILEQDYTVWPPEKTGTVRSLALHWFDQAVAEALAGGPVAPALERAQASASAFVACCAGQDETWAAYIACARQADPQIELSEQ